VFTYLPQPAWLGRTENEMFEEDPKDQMA